MIEADLQRHYNVDLCDLWRGTLTPRKVRVLIDGLPHDSRTMRALGDSEETWTLCEQLLARLIDEVAAHRWDFGFVSTDPAKRNQYRPFPEPVRPQREERREIKVVSPFSPALDIFVNSDDFQGVPQ